MANNCLDTRYVRTKCSDSRKGPPLRSWIWCILIKCFIGLPCIFSKCLGVDITVATYPQGTISVRYGEPLEIFCVAEGYSSDDLMFTVAGKHLESEKVNETTRRLYIKNPEKQLLSYYCQNKNTSKKCLNRVLVDSLPSNVTDFNCISNDLEVLNCSWSISNSKSLVNYTLTFSVDGNIVLPPCIAQDSYQTRYCVWNQSSIPRYRQQVETFHFLMTSCNVFGCNNQTFIIDHFSIVKPAKPIDLKMVKVGTHSIVLKWSISNNMVDLLKCGVDHIIEYQIAKVDNTSNFRRVDASSLPSNNKTYKFQLNDLPYAHMPYEVRIYIKTKRAVKRELWSDLSYIIFYTAGEKPHRPPDMIVGGFDQGFFDMGKRIINVYWKQLEEYEEAGANFTYKVLYTQGNNTKVIYPNKNKSLSFVAIENLTMDAMDVEVWSMNNNGSSPNNSHMYIPSDKEMHALSLTSFTKLAYENGTYELSWNPVNNIDNYTLFWCHHNATSVCLGRMDFAVLDPKKNNHVIDLPKEYRYQFAISANKGTSTTGMVWAKCDISKDGFVMYRFPAELKYDAPKKSSVHLRWSMNCALKDGVITGYNISYCPIVQTSTHCDTSVETKYKFISDPKKMDVLIENLHSSKTYQFTLSLNTNGRKKIEKATAQLTTLEDKPTSPVNIGVSDVRNDSLVISWNSPLQPNGKIGKYVILNYGKEFHVDKVLETSNVSRRQVTLTGLEPFKNYSFTVQACNTAIDQCSEEGPNVGIIVRTRIGRPGVLKAPTIKNSPDMITWEPPVIPGGTVDFYQVKKIIDDSNIEERNTTELYAKFIHCEGVVSTERYQVRAVNYDEDSNHGVLGIGNVTLPTRLQNESRNIFFGEWSQPTIMGCRNKGGLTMIFIFLGIFSTVGLIYCIIKLYKKYRKMEDIKPVLPNGLGIPEKDISKYTFAVWNPNNKDEKPSSDEMLLLPNSKAVVPPPNNTQKEDNCAASDHTDSTALSDSSRGPVDRQASTSSDEGSNSSLHMEVESEAPNDKTVIQENKLNNADNESLHEKSPYFPKAFTKNPTSGYVQPVVNPSTGYVQSAPAPVNSSPPTTSSQPAGSSYVMASLSPPIFTTGLTQPPMTNPPAPSSGYVLPAEAQARSMMNFSKLGPLPTKVLGPESLPTMPTLPPPSKHGADSSYIQLQSLDALPSLKPQVRNTVPSKPPTSSGYVSPGDVVINKHLNNMLSGSQLADESAILDPTMSPDAYCRFSWSTDPVNDNLHSLLADSTTQTSSKN